MKPGFARPLLNLINTTAEHHITTQETPLVFGIGCSAAICHYRQIDQDATLRTDLDQCGSRLAATGIMHA